MARVRPLRFNNWGPIAVTDAFANNISVDVRNYQKAIITIVNRDATDELTFRVFASNSTDESSPTDSDENWYVETTDTMLPVSTTQKVEISDANWVRIQTKNTAPGSDSDTAGIVKQLVSE